MTKKSFIPTAILITLGLSGCDQPEGAAQEAPHVAELNVAIQDLDEDQARMAEEYIVDLLNEQQDDAPPHGPDSLGVEEPKPQASWSHTTAWTSEEYPPVNCQSNSLMTGADCNGGYCDNYRLYCGYVSKAPFLHYWSPWFSNETPTRYCNGKYDWVSGVACNGSNCDNLSIECSSIYDSKRASCKWTDWHSEEQGIMFFPYNYYAIGIQCSGGKCDNKRYRICRMYF